MRSNRRTRALWAFIVPIVALLAFTSAPAFAQGPTQEGTTITNTATVSFTDANTNAYSNVQASVSVTVGFQGGLDVVDPSDVQPAANTTGNQITFTINNGGNGADSVNVSSVTATLDNGQTVVDNISYIYNGTPYADLTALNAALDLIEVPLGGSIDIIVVYDIPAGAGGLNADVTLTATSTRNNGNADTETVNVAPTFGGVVTMADAADVNRVPNPTGTLYTVTFPVTSTLTGSANVQLVASVAGPNAAGITIVSVAGTAGSSETVPFTFNSTQNVVVEYRVANNAAGAASDITLTATAQVPSPPAPAAQSITVTIIKPSIAITKGVFTDAAATVPVSGDVLPGQTLYYRVQVTNNGTAAANNVNVTDNLPGEVTYVGVTTGTGSVAWDSLTEAGGVVTATRSTLAVGASGIFIIQVTVN